MWQGFKPVHDQSYPQNCPQDSVVNPIVRRAVRQGSQPRRVVPCSTSTTLASWRQLFWPVQVRPGSVSRVWRWPDEPVDGARATTGSTSTLGSACPRTSTTGWSGSPATPCGRLSRRTGSHGPTPARCDSSYGAPGQMEPRISCSTQWNCWIAWPVPAVAGGSRSSRLSTIPPSLSACCSTWSCQPRSPRRGRHARRRHCSSTARLGLTRPTSSASTTPPDSPLCPVSTPEVRLHHARLALTSA